MNDALVTMGMMVGVTVILIIWDIRVAMNGIPNGDDTISGIMRQLGRKVAAVPFAWGVLAGHFWGPSSMGVSLWSVLILLTTAVLVSSVHKVWSHFGRPPEYMSLVYFLMGVPCGVFLWPQ